jgi:UPF0271 protein
MRYIASANVACGGHAGDEETMRKTLANAKELNVSVGAHPGYPDRENFGRIELSMPPREIEVSVREQIKALLAVANKVGVKVVHVKPHGALYHACNKYPEVARAVGRAVLAVDPKLMMFGQAGSAVLNIWREMGLKCVGEAFADRAYEPDGTLRNRNIPGALLAPDKGAQQAVSIALEQKVLDTSGNLLPVDAETICIHSDTPAAARMAKAVHQRLTWAGVAIRPVAA